MAEKRTGQFLNSSLLTVVDGQIRSTIKKADTFLRSKEETGELDLDQANQLTSDPVLQELAQKILSLPLEMAQKDREEFVMEILRSLTREQASALVIIQGEIISKRLENRS